ncbi:hypothetical protein, partial [Paraburkholderia sp.]|uniref:hypothetical protein n=1 Tax=Paraburkholderia sp. TaxID=1926495 RepID=UPI003D6E4168
KNRLAHDVLRLPALQMRNEINQPFGMTQNEAAVTRPELSTELETRRRHKLRHGCQPAWWQTINGLLPTEF